MKKIIFVVSSIYYLGDGYKARIDTEIEKLNKRYKIILFLPEYRNMDVELPPNISVVKYHTNYKTKLRYLYNNISFKKMLKVILKDNDNCIVVGESLIPSIKAYRISKKNKCKFVFDCHGTEPSEFKLNNPGIKGRILFSILKFMENIVVNNSDLIVTVTQKQFDYFGVYKNNVVFPMMPTNKFLSDTSHRDDIRKKLNIQSDELVFVYSGQNQKWQMCEEICELFRLIQRNQKNARFLVLTGCVDYFSELVKRKEIENAIVISVPYDEMPDYLDACDFGFCIRNSSIINQFASPTKVLEYVSRNITPILSEYVGDFSKTLSEEEIAYVVRDDEIPIFEKKDKDGREYVNKLNEKMVFDYITAFESLED